MSFDRIFPAKMTLGSVHLQRRKQNALNHFCGNHCGKEASIELQRSHKPGTHPVAREIGAARKYLCCLFVTAGTLAYQGLVSPTGRSIRGLGNLHRFGAFCSLRVTLIGICLSANRSFRDRVFYALTIATRFIDSLQPKAYSDFDQRHWRQAEVLP
jgi:hypothetical protein